MIPVDYRTQTTVTDPGAARDWLRDLPSDVPSLSRFARELVLHYRGADLAGLGIPPARVPEIHSRYADVMLARLRSADGRPLGTARAPADRTIGCCRDFAVLTLTLARHQGLPARLRIGFASYFFPGLMIDHAVAEVWDEAAGQWRLVDSQLDDDHRDPTDNVPIDRTDVPRDRFLTGGDAWQRCRQGADDPARFMVDPHVTEPVLRSWPYLAHNLILDLAALNRDELLLWDSWPFIEQDPLVPDQRQRLDEIAAATSGPAPAASGFESLYTTMPGLRAPNPLTRHDPLGGPPQLERRREAAPDAG